MSSANIGRREFLAGLGGVGAGLGLGGVSHWFPLRPPKVGPDWSPGREELVPSTCMLCPAHCGIQGRVVDGNLVGIKGNPFHPVSRGGICPKGVAGAQMLYHPGRLTGPVERVGPEGSADFRLISWEDALGKIVTALSDLRNAGETDSVMWLTGDTTGVMRQIIERFAAVYGNAHVVREDYSDGARSVMNLVQGIDSSPAFDLGASDLVLSFGAPLSEAWICPPQASWARGGAGEGRPRWLQVDVRHSRTAASADEWIPVRPGTYGVLALGIAYILLKEGLYDIEKVHDQVNGIEDWRGPDGETVPGFRTLVLRHGRTDKVSALTGAAPEEIIRVAKEFGGASRPLALWDHAVSWRRGGLPDAMAIHALNVLVGAPGRRGGVLLQHPPPVPALQEIAPAAADTKPRPAGPSLTATTWAERVADGGGPDLKALFLYCSNPVASSPLPEKVRAALKRIPLVVSFSPFLDESAKHANLVLPDHTYMERWEDAPAPSSVPMPIWNLVQPLVKPRQDTRATGDLILEMAAVLGGEMAEAFPWSSVEEIVSVRGKALAAARTGGLMDEELRREELRELQRRGWWMPHGMTEEQYWDALRKRGGWFDPYYDYQDSGSVSRHPDRKARIFTDEARELISGSVSDLAEGFLPVRKLAAGAAEGEEFPLTLVPFRVMTLASGGTSLMPWLLEDLGVLTGDSWEVWAEINPETAGEMGLSHGARVKIESREGAFDARLRIFPGAQPGVINVPYGLHTKVEGWGNAPVSNPLLAVGNRRDPSTGLPDWYSARVRVVPA